MTPIFALDTARACPHVGGSSTRFKATPLRLTRLAARIMCATGNFSTRRSPARASVAPFLGAFMALLAGATLVIAAEAGHVDGPIASAQAAISPHMFSLGVGEFSQPAARAMQWLSALSRMQ